MKTTKNSKDPYFFRTFVMETSGPSSWNAVPFRGGLFPDHPNCHQFRCLTPKTEIKYTTKHPVTEPICRQKSGICCQHNQNRWYLSWINIVLSALVLVSFFCNRSTAFLLLMFLVLFMFLLFFMFLFLLLFLFLSTAFDIWILQSK